MRKCIKLLHRKALATSDRALVPDIRDLSVEEAGGRSNSEINKEVEKKETRVHITTLTQKGMA